MKLDGAERTGGDRDRFRLRRVRQRRHATAYQRWAEAVAPSLAKRRRPASRRPSATRPARPCRKSLPWLLALPGCNDVILIRPPLWPGVKGRGIRCAPVSDSVRAWSTCSTRLIGHRGEAVHLLQRQEHAVEGGRGADVGATEGAPCSSNGKSSCTRSTGRWGGLLDHPVVATATLLVCSPARRSCCCATVNVVLSRSTVAVHRMLSTTTSPAR